MTGVEYSDGDVRWKAATVDHSTPTRARGETFAGALNTAGALATGASLMLKP